MALFLTQNLFVASGIDYWIYHAAADTLGHLLALKVTSAYEQDRAQVADLSKAVQEATGQSVQVAFVDQGYTGVNPAQAASSMELNWKSLNIMRPKGALSSCRVAGSWSDPSLGRRAFAGWPAIMNA